MSQYIFIKETTHKVVEISSTAHDRFRPSCGSSALDHFGAQLPCHQNEARGLRYCQVAQAQTEEVERQRSGLNHGPSGQ
ncbi:hypothetical protein T265_09783 [Opisthorchis viverrini]|uniref:Uncharacterized protein n=1 Tax=Opisthorchis viverrini TaxID=6198 RepID=A0A075A3Q4_OPIVI|nr:hypothetical protein T265_09783 [Opisthorchis viverrini]KER22029.1 hypothetical protein T265_09783 [Opisthorchis viverrini]